ncbi:MAG: phosphatase PAP2 family protein [Polyangiaceae bacterium]|nr:phosphatase PAP2 family protein [Polyangiaceae bacterium]
MGVAVFAALAIPPEPDRWRDMGSFDAEARSVLRIKDDSLRNTARDASDLVLTLMVNQLVVDATLVAWWGHDRPSVARELILMDLEAMAVMGGIQAIVSGVASRWRPYRDTCVGPEEKQTRDCRDNKEFRSFFSGHTSGAFTVAGLMCIHHAYLPLYGGGTREGLTCAASMAAAATVGMLRVVSDQHFVTDALVGAAVGTLSGLGIPWLLHYRGGADVTAAGSKSNSTFSVRLVPMPLGIGLAGEM